MSTVLPSPEPRVNPETKPFWDATTEGRLLIKWCNDCHQHYWYPRTICPICGRFNTSWVEARGTGEVYTFAISRRGAGEYKDAAPFVLAYVELDEGVRMLTNIVDVDPEALAIGDRVEVVFHDTGAGSALPRFRPASA